MGLPGGAAAGVEDAASTGMSPRPGRAWRVVLFFLYFLGLAFAVSSSSTGATPTPDGST